MVRAQRSGTGTFRALRFPLTLDILSQIPDTFCNSHVESNIVAEWQRELSKPALRWDGTSDLLKNIEKNVQRQELLFKKKKKEF